MIGVLISRALNGVLIAESRCQCTWMIRIDWFVVNSSTIILVLAESRPRLKIPGMGKAFLKCLFKWQRTNRRMRANRKRWSR